MENILRTAKGHFFSVLLAVQIPHSCSCRNHHSFTQFSWPFSKATTFSSYLLIYSLYAWIMGVLQPRFVLFILDEVTPRLCYQDKTDTTFRFQEYPKNQVTVGLTFPSTFRCTGLWWSLTLQVTGKYQQLTGSSSELFSLTYYSLPPPDAYFECKSHISHRWCSSLVQGSPVPRFPSLIADLLPLSSCLRSQVLFGSWDP